MVSWQKKTRQCRCKCIHRPLVIGKSLLGSDISSIQGVSAGRGDLLRLSAPIANKGFFLLSFRAAGWEVPDSPCGRPLCKLMERPVKKSCASCISLPVPQADFFSWLKSWQCNPHKFVCVKLSHWNLWPAPSLLLSGRISHKLQMHSPTAETFLITSGSRRQHPLCGYVLPEYLQKTSKFYFQ